MGRTVFTQADTRESPHSHLRTSVPNRGLPKPSSIHFIFLHLSPFSLSLSLPNGSCRGRSSRRSMIRIPCCTLAKPWICSTWALDKSLSKQVLLISPSISPPFLPSSPPSLPFLSPSLTYPFLHVQYGSSQHKSIPTSPLSFLYFHFYIFICSFVDLMHS